MSVNAANLYAPGNLRGEQREKLSNTFAEFFELNSPTFQALQQTSETDGSVGPYGLRIPLVLNEPGGHGGFTLEDPSFQKPIPIDTEFMLATPVGYAIGINMLGRAMDMLKAGNGEAKINFAKVLEYTTKAATKRINRLCHGDRTGALAYSSVTLGAGAGQTLTCETTAASTAGHTKGSHFLKRGHNYDAVTPGTNVVTGQILVTAESTNRANCTVTVTTGVTTGDAIVDRNSWKRYWPGLNHLIGDHQRVLQTRDTSLDPELNDPTIDLGDTTLTPSAFADLRAALQTRANEPDAFNGLTAIITPGQFSVLAKQGYGFREVGVTDTHAGMPTKYTENGVTFVLDADADDDRVNLWKNGALKLLIERKLGIANMDGNEWRMWFGSNDAGSDAYIRALTTVMTVCKINVRQAAQIKKAAISGVISQTNGSY